MYNMIFFPVSEFISLRIRKCKEVCKCYRLFMRYLVKAFQCRKALGLFSSYAGQF